MNRLDIKQPAVRFVQIVSFKPLLSAGETVTYVNALTRTARGSATDHATVVGTMLPSADTAKIELKQGTHDNDYGIRVLVSTSGGNVWEEDLVLPVWDLAKF